MNKILESLFTLKSFRKLKPGVRFTLDADVDLIIYHDTLSYVEYICQSICRDRAWSCALVGKQTDTGTAIFNGPIATRIWVSSQIFPVAVTTE